MSSRFKKNMIDLTDEQIEVLYTMLSTFDKDQLKFMFLVALKEIYNSDFQKMLKEITHLEDVVYEQGI